jgi:glyoxylase-like metal-dependent hydrolase (beta-lactamase superfamily II)
MELHLLKVGSCHHLECLAMRGGAFLPRVFPALSGLMIHPTIGPILFDTGYAEHFLDATGPFPERLYRWATPMRLPPNQLLERQLARFAVTLSDVRLCVVSHFHGDHIAGLRDLPNATILAMASGYEDLRHLDRWKGVMRGVLPSLLPPDIDRRILFAESKPPVTLPAPWTGLGESYDLLGDQSVIGVPLPGHAPGHMGLLIRDRDDRRVLLAGDASWSVRALREFKMPSPLVRPVIHDWNRYKSTLKLLHDLTTKHPEVTVLPSHCDTSLSSYQPSWNRQ